MIGALYTVHCEGVMLEIDPTGCYGWVSTEDSRAEARAAARYHKWSRVRRDGVLRDLCPSCMGKLAHAE